VARSDTRFWIRLAVGALGLFVGIDHLRRWLSDPAATGSLALGAACTTLGAVWIVYTLAQGFGNR
jgi:hypothetical protein